MTEQIKDLPWLTGYNRWLILPNMLPQLKPEHADPIMVLGAPRSGTSMSARLLQDLGVMMGFRVQAADHLNPTGYYEDRDFIEVHDALKHGMIEEPTAQHVLYYLFKLRQSIGIRWGFKVPKYVAWLPIILDWMPHTKFVLCIRPKEEVVPSIAKAWDVSLSIAEGAHDEFVATSDKWRNEGLLHPGNTEVVQFHEMRTDPIAVGQRVCWTCDLGEEAAEKVADVVGYIDPGMRT